MKLKKIFVALILFMSFIMIPISAETYGNSWWYHVAGGNSVARFESGRDTYSRYDDGHYLLFGSWDSVKKVMSWFGIDLDLFSNFATALDIFLGDYGDLADLYDYCGIIQDGYNILTRPSSSYDAMKAYAANDGDYWYAVIWIPY